MMRIVLYGINNRKLRMRVQSFLDRKNYEIIGVCDSILKLDILQGMKYIQIKDLPSIDFDYLLIMTEKAENHIAIENTLNKLGIENRKVIRPRLLWLENYEYIPDLYEELKTKKSAEYYCFGLSYSLRGIDFHKIKQTTIDCSWHGADLYYMHKCAQMFGMGDKTALFVMPYYYFDYDMSLFDYQFEKGQIFAFRGFKDFHNANKSNSKIIRDYLISFDMFGEKLWSNIYWKKEYPINKQSVKRSGQNISPIWKKEYRRTRDENLRIFSEMIKLFKRNIVIIPPLCKDCFNEKDLIYIEEKKNQFYMNMQLFENVEIYDFCDKVNGLESFYDYEHLNQSGKEIFTELVNKIL